MEIKKIFKKIKDNKYAFVGIPTLGSLMVGSGIVGLIMTPKYTYTVSNLDKSFDSTASAQSWIESNITSKSNSFRKVESGILIEGGNWDNYVDSLYPTIYNQTMVVTDEVVSFDSANLVTNASINGRNESDKITIYRTSTGTIDIDDTSAANTFIKSVVVYKNEFTDSSFDSHWDDVAKAEQDWEDKKVENNIYSSREEYQYDGTNWSTDEDIELSKAIALEIAKIVHTPEVLPTPGVESDYINEQEYTDELNAWIAANPEGTESDYILTTEYNTSLTAWIANNPEGTESDYILTTEYSASLTSWITNNPAATESDYILTTEYTDSLSAYLVVNPTETEADYKLTTEYLDNVAAYILANPEGTEEDYKLTTEHKDNVSAYILANPEGTEAEYKLTTEHTDNVAAYILANPEGTEADYKNTTIYTDNRDAWISANPDFGNTQQDEFWTYASIDFDTEDDAKASATNYANTLRRTRVRWTFDETNYDFDLEDDAKIAYRATLNKTGTSLPITFYYSDDSEINVSHSISESEVINDITSMLESKDGLPNANGDFDNYKLTNLFLYEHNREVDQYYSTKESIAKRFASDMDDNIVYEDVEVDEYSLDKTDATFESKEEALKFWSSQIKKVKK